jgi:hypothetical protein
MVKNVPTVIDKFLFFCWESILGNSKMDKKNVQK